MTPPGEAEADRGLDLKAAARRGAFFGVVAVAAVVLVATLPGVDEVRDRLAAAGVEVRDGPHGTEWALRQG